MNDPLSKYRAKRNPAATNEPFSAERSVRSDDSAGWSGRFVVHQHAATRMHYDLRLEIAGTLQSFAIPKGLTLDPEVKHMAIHTEAHPLEYLNFEDVIPEGNYGAGPMIVWDSGSFQFIEANGPDSLVRGKLDFVLDGFKAKGRFALIATGRRKAATGLAGSSGAAAEWLLIKKKDEHAKLGSRLVEELPRSVLSGLTVEELPRKQQRAEQLLAQARELASRYARSEHNLYDALPITPMLCESQDGPVRSSRFLYELKLDGVRIIAHKSENDCRLFYRSKRSATRSYADIARAMRHLPVGEAVFDGEIVAFDAYGHPSFERLAPRIQSQRAGDLATLESTLPVFFMIFDVLQLGDVNLQNVPLFERKALLQQIVATGGCVRALDHIAERGDALWAMCESQKLEGMVAKRADSPYVEGPSRSGNWVKIKRAEDDDFVIIGYRLSERGELRSLGLASYRGEQLVYRGRVGSGLSNTERSSLMRLLRPLSCDSPALVLPATSKLTPVTPALVAKVRAQGYSDAGHLRAPVYLGLHESKLPTDCIAGPADERTDALVSSAVEQKQGAQLRGAWSPPQNSKVRFSNLSKLYFPDDGYTKSDVLAYYEAIAPFMLPHLEGRPVVLVRYPDGISGKSFYQWRAPDKSPEWLRTFELYDEEKQREKGSGKAAFLVDDVDTLLHIANLGCIPLHVLACRERTRAACDFLTIDFDIGEQPFSEAVRLALTLRELLDDLGLVGFPKTSGQRGLHVLVPLGPSVEFSSAKLLCELLGRLIVGRHPELCTMERRIDKRAGRIYIDTGQTGRSRTIVAPYSVRAYPGARVSCPLQWRELHLALDPAAFTIETVVQRVLSQGDPMAQLLQHSPDLSAVLARLARWTGQASD